MRISSRFSLQVYKKLLKSLLLNFRIFSQIDLDQFDPQKLS